MWNRKVFIRIIEVILCLACVVALRVTDDESRRVFHYLRSRSREWSLLNNVTWGAIGAALATATCGGYIIIATGLLIAAATGELTGRKTEIFFLGLGVILFGIVGALSMASIENVPEDLVDNAAVFGALCLLTALVFIADLLMSTPKKKIKETIAGHLTDKRVKRQEATLTTEKESKSPKASSSKISKIDDSGAINDGFEKVEEQRQKSSFQEPPEDSRRWEQERSSNQMVKNDHDRNSKEYSQNFENGRALRDSQRYRDSETQMNGKWDSYKMDHRIDAPTVMYKAHDIYQRPVDEVDTPRFPVEMDNKREIMFAKVVNPGVKIMKVERDVEEAFDTYSRDEPSEIYGLFDSASPLAAIPAVSSYGGEDQSNWWGYSMGHFLSQANGTLSDHYCTTNRAQCCSLNYELPGMSSSVDRDRRNRADREGYTRYSDQSQYDNVPIRMRRISPRSQRKNRDVTFNVPPPPKNYGKAYERAKDEIEMLEECFGSLRTSSTGTQTPGASMPSSPTDPGYVRHTASNWPQETKMKTPASSPSHVRT